MVEGKEIPETPVFLDSPLALKVTDIYKKYEDDFKGSVKEEIKKVFLKVILQTLSEFKSTLMKIYLIKCVRSFYVK